jgi:hypothetical protein
MTQAQHVGSAKRTGHPSDCYCGRRARWHVMYGSGCGNVCGTHMRSILAAKGGAAVVIPLDKDGGGAR